jgi:hypothetical protein
MSATDELPYFGTSDNPTQVAEEITELDITGRTDLLEIKKDMTGILQNLGLNVAQSAEDVKIEAVANQKVRVILQPIIDTINEKLKTGAK